MMEIESQWTARDRELKMFGRPARTFLRGVQERDANLGAPRYTVISLDSNRTHR
jgi:hypothetical protein